MDNELNDSAAWEAPFRSKQQQAPAFPATPNHIKPLNLIKCTPPTANNDFGQNSTLIDFPLSPIPAERVNAPAASSLTEVERNGADVDTPQRLIPDQYATTQITPGGTGGRAPHLVLIDEGSRTAVHEPRPHQTDISGPIPRVTNFGPQRARRFQHPSPRQRLGNTIASEGREQKLSSKAQALADYFNANKSRWNKKGMHNGIFRLPQPWRTYRNTFQSMWKKLYAVQARTGAFIAFPINFNDRELLIYGSTEQQKAARVALTREFGLSMSAPELIPRSPPQWNDPEGHGKVTRKKDDKFATTYSTMNQEQEMKQQVEDKKKIDGMFFRNKYDHDSAERPGYFLWPTEDMSIDEAFENPNELAELNFIRSHCCCFIDYAPAISAIRVSAEPSLTANAQEKAVTNAVKAIRHHICQLIIEMKKSIGTFLKSFNVQTPSVHLTGLRVRLQDRVVNGEDDDFQIAVLTHEQNGGIGSTSIYAGNSETGSSNETRMRLAVKHVLPGLRYRRGLVRMSVNFGTFGLRKYRQLDNTYQETLEEFRSIVADQNTDGLLFPSLRGGVNLRDRCMAATELLIPFENNVMSLKEAKLRYSAKFEFPPGNDGRAAVYETSFTGSQYSNGFEREFKSWYVEANSNGNPEVLLDFNVIDFETCPWNLQITVHEQIEPRRVTEDMRKFGDSVHLRRDLLEDILARPTEKFEYTRPIQWPRRIIETTSLRFRLHQDSSYVLEIYRRDTFFPKPSQHVGQAIQDVPKSSSSWAASLYHQEWANCFGENAALKVGEVVSWKANLSDFFPQSTGASGQGIASGATNFHRFWEMVESVSAGLGLKGENIMKAETRAPATNGSSNLAQPPSASPKAQASLAACDLPTSMEYCKYWTKHGWCKRKQNCQYKHVMPTDFATLSGLDLEDIPHWYHNSQSPVSTTPKQSDVVPNGELPHGSVHNGGVSNNVFPKSNLYWAEASKAKPVGGKGSNGNWSGI